jgi:hypothetical protein
MAARGCGWESILIEVGEGREVKYSAFGVLE